MNKVNKKNNQDRILVCPGDLDLLQNIKRNRVIVKTDSISQIGEIEKISTKENEFVGLILSLKRAEIDLLLSTEFCERIPINLFTSTIGDFKDYYSLIHRLKTTKVKLFLSSGIKQNYTTLKILSSLQVPCGILLENDNEIDWERLTDLMVYSFYTRTNHASIEPFHNIDKRYKQEDYIDFGDVYFENPKKYLHLDHKGNVALSSKGLKEGMFIDWSFNSNLEELEKNERYEAEVNRWQRFFLERHPCSYCPGWKVCLGKFAEPTLQSGQCKIFFEELLEACQFKATLAAE